MYLKKCLNFLKIKFKFFWEFRKIYEKFKKIKKIIHRKFIFLFQKSQKFLTFVDLYMFSIKFKIQTQIDFVFGFECHQRPRQGILFYNRN